MTMLARTSRMGGKCYLNAPYSPDMSPPDFILFPKLKEHVRGQCFSSLEKLSTDGTQAIRHINGVLEE